MTPAKVEGVVAFVDVRAAEPKMILPGPVPEKSDGLIVIIDIKYSRTIDG